MRSLLLVAMLAVSSPAYAGGFAELGGGVMIPVADNDWTDYVDSGPKLFVRAGAMKNALGAMLSIDWSPINTDAQGWSGMGTYQDISAYRFRILANVAVHMKAGAKLTAGARLGAGVDFQHIHVRTVVGPFASDLDDSHAGFALEPAAGIWYGISDTLQLGAELALPISFHSERNDQIPIRSFTSLDIDILFGVRFTAQ